jgi:CHAT domain-containing protein
LIGSGSADQFAASVIASWRAGGVMVRVFLKRTCLQALLCIAVLLFASFASPRSASAVTRSAFVAPRTIADITAILDQEKPDPAKRTKTEAEAVAEPPAKADRATLKEFYYRRAQARTSLGRLKDAVADCERAVANTTDYVNEGFQIELFQEGQMRLNGDFKEAIALLERIRHRLNLPNANRGRAFGINDRTTLNFLLLGEINKAEIYVKRNFTLLSEARSWPNTEPYQSGFEFHTEFSKGRLFYARGQYREAEVALTLAEARQRDALVRSRSWPVRVPQSEFESAIDYAALYTGFAKAGEGRYAEAEIDIRRALLSRLKLVGKYHVDTANMLNALSLLLFEQTRLKESEALARAALEILDAIGYGRETNGYANPLSRLAAAIFEQRRYGEAKQIYMDVDAATRAWSKERSAGFRSSWTRIYVHYYTGEIDKGLEYAREILDRTKFKGEQHYETAMARADLATGLALAKRDAEAMQEFRGSIPVLLGATSETDDEDATVMLSAERRLQTVVEAYISLLARSNAPNRAEEGLRLAEAIRGRSVQNALAASAARAAARTPALTEVVRKEQDLHKQVLAQAGLLNNVLAEPPEQREAKTVAALQQELARLRKERQEAKRELERRFPQYASLVRPPPGTIEDIRSALKSDEAFISFYFGQSNSFVWAVPRLGGIAFAPIALTADDLESKVQHLRAALEPPAVTTIYRIPQFDLTLAYELYRTLLEPVEAGWKQAKTLIVVTNGALGLLPLSLLPTKPANLEANTGPRFSAYQQVTWLARTHAVTMVPSAAALRTLRQMPAGSAKREPLIGFGDPYFSTQQADEDLAQGKRGPLLEVAALPDRDEAVRRRAAVETRKIDSADLAKLPRLPDTADELKSIALSLKADPSKALYLGKAANEAKVKGIDLTKFRIVAFATHGLMPGDLNGLTQPALALTAPNVADVEGDGLLTMEEVLALKLDADWVILSACNTASGAAAGAEAVSGLGRAFFYAGARALLVTNWAVMSDAATALVTDLFRRQAADPGLGRAEALRQAMLGLIDGPGYVYGGKTVYSYAHPLFWAPYTIIGDGSSQ